MRAFPSDTRREDPRVNLPLGYLAEKVAAGHLGGTAREILSFSGYQPDARTVGKTKKPGND